jgi:hypothetical protein
VNLLAGGAVLIWTAALTWPQRFDDIQAVLEGRRRWEPWLARQETEQAWFRAARTERTRRRTTGWLELGVGALSTIGCTTVAIVDGAHPAASPWDIDSMVGCGVVGAVTMGMGAYLLATEGPVESGLREYEHSAGSVIQNEDTATLQPIVAPVPGGAVAGLGGRF